MFRKANAPVPRTLLAGNVTTAVMTLVLLATAATFSLASLGDASTRVIVDRARTQAAATAITTSTTPKLGTTSMAMLRFTNARWKQAASRAGKVASRSELPATHSALFEHLRGRFWESMKADAYGLVDLELSNEAKLRLSEPQNHAQFKAWMDEFLQPPSGVRLVDIGTLPTQSPFPQIRFEGPSHMGMLQLHTDGGRAIHLTATMSKRGLGTQVLMTGNRSRKEVARAVAIANDALAMVRQEFSAIDGLWADAYRTERARRANGADAWFAHQWEHSFIAEEGELLGLLNPATENAELFRETGGVIHRRPTELIVGTPRVLSVYRG